MSMDDLDTSEDDMCVYMLTFNLRPSRTVTCAGPTTTPAGTPVVLASTPPVRMLSLYSGDATDLSSGL